MEAGGIRTSRISYGWECAERRSRQQPRQILIMRSTAASSALSCSSSLGFSDGTSLARGWRWLIGALPINRVSRISEDTAGLAGPADALAFPMVCATAARLPSRASNANVLINFRMIGFPEIAARRYSLREDGA
jgi:hypothetical protein